MNAHPHPIVPSLTPGVLPVQRAAPTFRIPLLPAIRFPRNDGNNFFTAQIPYPPLPPQPRRDLWGSAVPKFSIPRLIWPGDVHRTYGIQNTSPYHLVDVQD